MKEEIISGLKQAIERGYSLEQAKISFINAGYSKQEVNEAANSLGGVLTNYPFQSPQLQLTPQPLSQPTKPPIQPRQKKTKKLIIVLIILLLLLLLWLGLSAFFGDKLVKFIADLF